MRIKVTVLTKGRDWSAGWRVGLKFLEMKNEEEIFNRQIFAGFVVFSQKFRGAERRTHLHSLVRAAVSTPPPETFSLETRICTGCILRAVSIISAGTRRYIIMKNEFAVSTVKRASLDVFAGRL